MNLRKKPEPAPAKPVLSALEERLSSAIATKEAALSVFANLVRDLEDAETIAIDTAAQIQDEVDRLNALRLEADAVAYQARVKANKIRDLV